MQIFLYELNVCLRFKNNESEKGKIKGKYSVNGTRYNSSMVKTLPQIREKSLKIKNANLSTCIFKNGIIGYSSQPIIPIVSPGNPKSARRCTQPRTFIDKDLNHAKRYTRIKKKINKRNPAGNTLEKKASGESLPSESKRDEEFALPARQPRGHLDPLRKSSVVRPRRG